MHVAGAESKQVCERIRSAEDEGCRSHRVIARTLLCILKKRRKCQKKLSQECLYFTDFLQESLQLLCLD